MGCSHSRQPVLAGIGAVVLIACLAVPGLLRADYRIIHKETTILTRCYWIQRSMLHLCEGGEPLAMSDVGAIEAGDMNALEAELHRETLRRFFIKLSWLGDNEAEIIEHDKALAEGFLELDELLKQGGQKKDLRETRKRLLDDVDDIRRRVVKLKGSWEDLRIPERKLMKLQELKSLQILTWLQSLQEMEIFLEILDPTFRAYALEHGRQSVQFGEIFRDALEDFAPGYP